MALVRLTLLLALLPVLLCGCYTTSLSGGPAAAASRPGSHGHSKAYIVRRGDTLYSIGRLFGIDYHIIARRNHIRYPYPIYVGQRIYPHRIAPPPTYLPIRKSKKKVVRKKKVSTKKRVRKSSYHKKQRRTVARHTGLHLRWPVHGRVTSVFGMRHRRMHDGIDIGAKTGSPVYAAASGEVVYSDHRLSGYGRMIIIRHSPDLFTAYAHNQRNLVRRGDRVQAGAVIARVGRSGRASGPHLHFEVRRGETPVDPLAYLPRK